MWRKIFRDVGLEMARAGTREALRKIDGAIAEEQRPEKVVVDVLCKGCRRIQQAGEAFCAGCGKAYAGG